MLWPQSSTRVAYWRFVISEIFKGLNMSQPNDEELSKWLKQSAEISAKRGYHGKGSGGGQSNRNSLNLSGSVDNLPTSPPSVSPRGGTNPWTNNGGTPNLRKSREKSGGQNKTPNTPNNNGNNHTRRSTNSPYSGNNNTTARNNSSYHQQPAYFPPEPAYYYNAGYNNSYYDNTTDTTYYNTEYYDNEYYNQGGYYDALANNNYMLDYSSVAPDSASEGNSSENSSENGDWQEVSYKKPASNNNHVNRGRGRGQLKRPYQNKRQ